MSLAHLPVYVNQSGQSDAAGGWRRLANPRLRVALDPGGEGMLNHRIFEENFVTNSGWMEPNVVLAARCRERGIDLSTRDLILPEEADVMIYINLPERREQLEELERKAPGIHKILIASESPVVQPHAAVTANLDGFDLILTPNPNCAQVPGFRRTPLAIGNPPVRRPGKPFDQRRLCTLINTNIQAGILRANRPWRPFELPGKLREKGWILPWQRYLDVSRRNDYHRRRKFARAFEKEVPGGLDVFGRGWEAQNHGWFFRFFPEAPYGAWKGPLNGDKFDLLGNYKFAFAYENFHGNEGYVSEKIFDVLFAGTVPLYFGDECIHDIIPRGCFVDRRDYRSDAAMIRDIAKWDADRWETMRDAGQDAIRSPRLAPVLPDAFAEQVIDAIEALTGGCSRFS